MAVDFINGNLYAVENSTGALIVIDASSQKYTLLSTDLNDPLEIVLDPFEGIMFILLRDEIQRTHMDGSGPLQSIVSKSNVASLTLDREKKRLYWVRDKLTIESSDYDGIHETTLLIDSDHLVSLAVAGDRLFWLWHRRTAYKSVEPILWSCSLGNESCSDHSMHTLDRPTDFSLMRTVSGMPSNASSPCRPNRGGCQDICLASPGGGHKCACRLGWRLNLDDRTCREVTEFMLLVWGEKVRGLRLDSLRGEDVFWPTPFRAELTRKPAIHFDYDLRNDIFYFTDDTAIHRMKLKSSSWTEQSRISVNQSIFAHTPYLFDIAYDWLSGNLYCSAYTLKHSHISEHMILQSVRDPHLVEDLFKVVSDYWSEDIMERIGTTYLEGLAIDPIDGYMFFPASRDGAESIIRTSLDGTSDSQVLSHDSNYFSHQLAIDYDDKRVYWISDPHYITHGKFDGTDLRSIYVGGVDTELTAIAVYQRWIYLATDHSIWRFHKDDHSTERYNLMPATRSITRLKVISAIFQVEEGIGCGKNNGGCEKFCFYAPKISCDCQNGEIVQPDGRCSVHND